MTENNADGDAGGDVVCQIYETFIHNKITDVAVMQPTVLEHYEVMEPIGLEQLRTVKCGHDQ